MSYGNGNVTELDDKQQGSAIYLSLPCDVCQTCIDISVSSLNSENDLKILLEESLCKGCSFFSLHGMQ